MKFAFHIGPSGSTFVKAYDFFVSQGGLKEEWGNHWKIIDAPDLQGARMVAIHSPGARFGLFCGHCGAESHIGACKDPRCKRCGKSSVGPFCGPVCARA